MFLARVVGKIAATIKHDDLRGKKILLVRPLDLSLSPTGKSVIAIDSVDAGAGDMVLVADEGNAAAQVLGMERGPIRTVIVGVIDTVDIPERE
ncbi:MAG: EutN/CcmL family microcompartment protein [Candidatus Eiseniibacteriota bacterium]|nr:MAG: EutN/CcmL family microcompartment protein [Candidatus Eisenbacteria bacterium]